MTTSKEHPLRVARKARGWSLEELGRRTGLSNRTIFRIETGESRPHGPTRRLIAEALGIDAEELFAESAVA